ncbi:ABC transporter permease subunit [Halorhodospira halochloris]|uniref:ABC transporter permease subunit n=1 Tax=Halorhodospira halochloris TaxID=1052 RepID=UPI001EE99D4C|nr:ABC transporter permease subunit [Halorhodospira halochloris]MCG5548407.1 ABC transporter permease subunit [Halorhodospira halochloris]
MPDARQRRRLRLWRGVKDHLSKTSVAFFGLAVIGALALMFVYLFSETAPIFSDPEITPQSAYPAPGGEQAGETVHAAMERYREIGVRFTDQAHFFFFLPDSGEVIKHGRLQRPAGVEVRSFDTAEARHRLVGYGLDDGTAIFARHDYDISYPDDERLVEPYITYPEGEGEPLDIFASNAYPIDAIGVQRGNRGSAVVAANNENQALRLVLFEEDVDFLTGEATVEREVYDIPWPEEGVEITRILLDTTMRNLYIGGADGRLHYYDVANLSDPRLVGSERAIGGDDAQVTELEFLLGAVSIIVGGSDGSVSQWMVTRDEDRQRSLTEIRDFVGHNAPVTAIAAEHGRKGFASAAADGTLQLHYATSARTLTQLALAGGEQVSAISMAPRHDGMLAVAEGGGFNYLHVNNPHPEVSFKALWQKVWYEGRDAPAYVWQSSSASEEFEPKFSLVPLTVGTLKAAFYAMLFAAPIAILGAIYSAYFMSPRMRQVTKPAIEIMEALPTVILGFLAGLWAAPFFERNLPAIFTILVALPIAMVFASWLWTRVMPEGIRKLVAPGWEAALLIPVVLFVGWIGITASPYMELAFFGGDMRQWLTDQGIDYDQRNALVVGIAMGFAVIPTIFSISEDAVFNVPRHLSQGALALGATPWQAVATVVLLTASPGIFSAVMIGFGRAVGETMIVVMATGNSPVTNFNIFEGMRTLSANIAVEMKETAQGGTHYRILFLAALVLFVLTFVVNTAAEIVRHRLRRKYSAL